MWNGQFFTCHFDRGHICRIFVGYPDDFGGRIVGHPSQEITRVHVVKTDSGNFPSFHDLKEEDFSLCGLKFIVDDLVRGDSKFGEHPDAGFDHHGRTAEIVFNRFRVRVILEIMFEYNFMDEAV
jgi:hypothetical protein